MINPRKFALLGTKQKIYKIASTIRNIEIELKHGEPINLSETFSYVDAIKNQAGRKIERCLEITNSIKTIDKITDIKEQIKVLNFAYHNLLDILEQKADEDKKFSFIQFDKLDKEAMRYPWIGILDNLRSPMNVGTIIRSADGFGAGKLFLTGITPHPPNTKISRTALGAEEYVPIEYFENTEKAISKAQELGYKIIALEITEPSKKLEDIKSFQKCAFIFGNEEFGITDHILSLCNDIVRLPLVGKKNSINVGNVFSIVAHHIANSFQKELS